MLYIVVLGLTALAALAGYTVITGYFEDERVKSLGYERKLDDPRKIVIKVK